MEELRRWLEGVEEGAGAACFASLAHAAPLDYRRLATMLALEWRAECPRRVGLSGGQGAGKTTLARLLEAACAFVGRRLCVLSIDDFYLTKQERRALAVRIHPLFETRGPPGTHDLARLTETIEALQAGSTVSLPVFDKGLDDRVGERSVEGPFDSVLLEGWCVGARELDSAALREPINRLEAREDPDGVWRSHIALRLASDYRALWQTFDAWVGLRVPDLASVRRWRLAQEAGLPPGRRMSADRIDRFVAHFERVTLAMAHQEPRRGEWTVALDGDHGVSSVTRTS